ncbi:CD83 antigen [Siphateles boraxobius]|uniref:CD83 antigen n=1 Tax=Siphateles boraxobius TaxID=180520 RepID=UPI004062FA52
MSTPTKIARTMHYFSEFIVCLVTLAVAKGVRNEIRTVIGEDVELPCAAKSKASVEYRLVTWYKVVEGPPRTITGLVRLTKNNGKVEKYKGVEREVELLEKTQSLLLSNVTAQDSGIYNCFLSAPLGHQNQEGEIVLKVYEHCTVEQMEFNKGDTIYVVVAVTVLGVSLLMLCLSYVCLRNVFQSNKKVSKDSLLKMPHQGKNLIVTKHLDCKTLPEVFV